jgi:formamidopyrimidine-DNA glycosylase
MPELPEVETVKEALKTRLLGLKITGLKILYDGIIKNIDINEFRQKVIGQTFNDIKRYGKYLIFVLDDISLVCHLRMEGKYFIKPMEYETNKHEHIIFFLSNNQKLTYQDVRKFGTIEVTPKNQEFNLPSLIKLGPEANDANLDFDYLYQAIHRSSRPIKSILLDQTVISGLGNIYVDETLFLAKVHPETKGNLLSKKAIEKIKDSAKIVLDKAIKLGGTTIRTYQSSFGIDGRFQNELNVHTLVGEPCKVCSDIIKKIKVGGRGTYFCPTCQKKE